MNLNVWISITKFVPIIDNDDKREILEGMNGNNTVTKVVIKNPFDCVKMLNSNKSITDITFHGKINNQK